MSERTSLQAYFSLRHPRLTLTLTVGSISPEAKPSVPSTPDHSKKKVAAKAPPTPNKSPSKSLVGQSTNPKMLIMLALLDMGKAGPGADAIVEQTGE